MLLLLLLTLPGPVIAAPVTEVMKDLPVLHEGRIKPMDTAARNMVRFLTGGETADGKSAVSWLAHALFSPAYAVTSPVIRVDTRREVSLLNLPPSKGRLYSAEDITLARMALTAQGQDVPISEDLETRLALIHQISHTLTPFLPLTYEAFSGQTLLDVLRGNDGSLDNPVIASVMMQGQNNILLRLIPHPNDADLMITPWQVMAGITPSTATQESFTLWQDAAKAWHAGQHGTWKTHIDGLTSLSMNNLALSPTLMRAEVMLNALNPLLLVMGLSIIALFIILLRMVGLPLPDGFIRISSLFAMGAGFALILAKMAGRVFILERPPVGTLYESILFVLLIILGYGFLKCLRRGAPVMLAGGVLVLSLILTILARVHDSDADNMMMLGAVLNSHFWLIVHVLVITAGYAVCLLCSLVAYLVLLRPTTPAEKLQSHPFYPVMIRSALAALALTATGTVLGGIWADQSWGRFWGWDPKENGALLIVIWLAWALHARLTEFIAGPWVPAAFALTGVCVALSWFGVNLLGVGLHSYGFTEGAFTGLMAFIIGNILALAILIKRWNGNHAS